VATKYHCYLLDQDRVTAMQVLDCDDASALLEADRILAASPCTAPETWDRNRQASIINKNSSTTERRCLQVDP
jgi:hypothetical protein